MPPGYARRRWNGLPLQEQPEDVQARLAELDDLRQRVVELEERVDFAERLLAKQREAEPLR
jgi:Tfp pilus assembly protein PilO